MDGLLSPTLSSRGGEGEDSVERLSWIEWMGEGKRW